LIKTAYMAAKPLVEQYVICILWSLLRRNQKIHTLIHWPSNIEKIIPTKMDPIDHFVSLLDQPHAGHMAISKEKTQNNVD